MKTLLPAKRNSRIAEQFVRPTVFYSFIDDRYIHIIHEKDENLVGLRYFQFLLPDINLCEILSPSILGTILIGARYACLR